MTPRWALVTGAAHRLGREIAMAFARAGWSVLVHYRSQEREALQTCEAVRALGVQAHALQADLGELDAPAQLMQVALAHTGGFAPGAVVNNASLFDPDEGFDFSPELMQRQLQVNCTAALQLGALTAQAARSKPTDVAPAVIHILDQKVLNLNPDYFSYTVSKLALHQAVALQAQALSPHVRVVGIAPGLMYPSGPQTDDNFARAASVNLMRSPINPQDVARTVVFVSETASIQGVTIAVDKGQHLVPLARDVMFAADLLKPTTQP